MFPEFVIFNKTIPTYSLMALIGILTTGVYLCKKAKKRNIDDNDVIVTLLIACIGVLIGGHIMYGITQIKLLAYVLTNLNIIKSFTDFINVVASIFGGSVFYGGLLGGLLAGYIYLKKTKKDVKMMTNFLAPGIPLFHAFGRIGCFLGGCCYGLPSSVGFMYNHSLMTEANGVVRFPIQLVEATLNFILFFVLIKLEKKEKFKDHILQIYLISYSIIRFTDEFFRGDQIRGFIFGLSTSQFISVLIFVATIISFFVIKGDKKAQETE